MPIRFFIFILIATTAFAQKPDAPVRGFLIIEPFETRVEFLLKVSELTDFLEISSDGALDSAEVRERLRERAKAWPTDQFLATAPAQPLAFELSRVDFVKADPKLGIAVDEREQIPVSEAKIGLVFSAKTIGPPKSIDLEWNFFPNPIREVTFEFGASGKWSARILTPEKNTIHWENADDLVTIPTLERIPVPNSRKPLNLPLSTIATVLGLIFLAIAARKKSGAPAWAGIGLIVCIVAAIALRKAPRIPLPNPFSKTKPPSAEIAENITYALLKNIYGAFEYRTESDVYDALDQTVTGDLLEQIYLEIQASLQLENQGGARVRVFNLDLKKCEPTGETDAHGFVAVCQWITAGTVTHWGHTHERTNRYEAVLTIDPVGAAWKLSALKLVNEERVDQQSRKN